MQMEDCELECSISIETLGHVGKIQRLNNCMVTLGRDQFRDIVVKIASVKGGKTQDIVMKDVKLFKKFLREGKATIRTQGKLQLLVSNCPPDRLAVFLKMLAIKLGIMKGNATDKTRLYSSLPKTFQFISPLTEKDCLSYQEKAKQHAGKAQVTKKTLSLNPRAQITDITPKRKRDNGDECLLPRKRINSSANMPPGKPMIDLKRGSKLTKEQKEILEAVLQGSNVFFTGSAGTGKSYLLKRIIGALPPGSTVAAASTGIAACHIGGITLHSFAGIGSGSAALEKCFELSSRHTVKQQWKKCQYLIIDEISMIEASFFDKIESVARFVRKNEQPFGGIQLILCGDFLQLPPVVKDVKAKKKFCFQAESWRRCVHKFFELTQVMRQEDVGFINILQYIRVGKCPDEVYEKLHKNSFKNIEQHGIQATKLCTHKDDVEEMNKLKMKNLKGETKVFFAVDSDSFYTDQMDKFLPVKQRLELKVGAQVMLTKNLDLQKGLVNGARGVIKQFQSNSASTPVIKLINGREIALKIERFTLGIPGGGMVTRLQLPLKLAWAISIHKSQGLTLDCVEVSLARVFEDGQAYVALSRAKSLQGLRILDLSKQCFRAHPDALKFYIKLRQEIKIKREIEKENSNFVTDF